MDGDDLGEGTSFDIIDSVLSGGADDAQLAALAVGVRMKGETVNELVGFARATLARSLPLRVPDGAVDIVGTGGSVDRQRHALNVSTMASFVAAACGATVCKHGNYKASSTSGAFDFLTELGIGVDLDPAGIERCVAEVGLGFAPARMFHPAMRHVASGRSSIGVRTFFNVLGPLVHPGRVRRQLVGAANERTAAQLAEVFHRLGSEHAWVVSGAGGLDEISTTGPSVVYITTRHGVRRIELDVRTLGITPPTSSDDLIGGTASDNVTHFTRIINSDDTGPRHDIVALNAGAALVVAGITDDLADGITRANEAIATGAVTNLVEQLRALTNTLTTGT